MWKADQCREWSTHSDVAISTVVRKATTSLPSSPLASTLSTNQQQETPFQIRQDVQHAGRPGPIYENGNSPISSLFIERDGGQSRSTCTESSHARIVCFRVSLSNNGECELVVSGGDYRYSIRVSRNEGESRAGESTARATAASNDEER